MAPLYMVATVLFNFGATLGITTFIVQHLSNQTIIYVLPLFIFIMLVAVGADYDLFLMSRIREEAASTSTKSAVANAVTHTGGVISTCGIILAGTFSVLILSPLQMVHQIGLAIGLVSSSIRLSFAPYWFPPWQLSSAGLGGLIARLDWGLKRSEARFLLFRSLSNRRFPSHI